MSQHVPAISLSLLSLVAAVLATGCGGGGGSDAAAPAVAVTLPAPAPAASAPSPAASAPAPAASAPTPAPTPPPAPPPAPAPDTVAPTVSIGSSAAGAIATGDVTFSFSFSEDVGVSFTTEDLIVAGGSKGSFTRISGTQATLVVVPTPGTTGTINISAGAATFTDLAGNNNTLTIFAAQAYNTTAMPASTSYIVQPYLTIAGGSVTQSSYTAATGRALTGQYETGFYAAMGTTWWWGGNYKDRIQGGYGVSKTDSTQSFFGSYVKHGGAGWDISTASTYLFKLGTNPECAGRCTATLRLVSTQSATCVADATLALTASELTAYTKSLSAFTVTGCTSNTVAAFKQVRVAELHFQMLRAGMQFTAGNTDAARPSLYPNGLDMGGSVGFDAPTGAPPPAAD